MCKICLKLSKKTPERRQWRLSAVFIVNFEQITHIVLVFPLFTKCLVRGYFWLGLRALFIIGSSNKLCIVSDVK